jgi:ribose transport system permease protein
MNTMKHGLKKLTGRSETSVFAAVLLLGFLFSVFSSNFLSSYNIYNLSRTAALYIFIALSQASVIIVGGMNLSLGYIGGMTVVAAGYMMQNWGASIFATIVGGLTIGVIAGLFNGLVITKMKINSFVVTLATSFIFKGLVTGVSEGFPYTNLTPGFTTMGRGMVFGLPYMIFLAIAVLLGVWYLFKYTIIGRKLLATGGNLQAARMAAINTDNTIIIANVLSGLFAAIAGLCAVSMNGSAQPTTGGDWMVYSFAVAVIGGTALSGGAISAVGIFIASFLIVMIKNGLVMINANIYFEQSYLGLILLIAVSLSSISSFLTERKNRRQFILQHQ